MLALPILQPNILTPFHLPCERTQPDSTAAGDLPALMRALVRAVGVA